MHGDRRTSTAVPVDHGATGQSGAHRRWPHTSLAYKRGQHSMENDGGIVIGANGQEQRVPFAHGQSLRPEGRSL